jgi:hypothetical protein
VEAFGACISDNIIQRRENFENSSDSEQDGSVREFQGPGGRVSRQKSLRMVAVEAQPEINCCI